MNILANGKQINTKDERSLHYAWAREGFHRSFVADSINNLIREAFETQKDRDATAILLVFLGLDKDWQAITADALERSGASVIESADSGTVLYIIMDASNISWFAYNQ